MGKIIILRGKAATGKTTLANMLAIDLAIPIIRKDDIVDGLKMNGNVDKNIVNNEICYNILYKVIQTNLDLGVSMILDIALGDRKNAEWFFSRLDFHKSNIMRFFIDCSDEIEWKRRHIERLQSPLLHQSFQSFEDVMEHYKHADVKPFSDEIVIDNSNSINESYKTILDTIIAKG